MKVTSNKWKWRDWQNWPKFDECELNCSNHFNWVCNLLNIYIIFHVGLFCVGAWIQIASIGELGLQVLFWEGFKFRSDYEIQKIKITESDVIWRNLMWFCGILTHVKISPIWNILCRATLLWKPLSLEEISGNQLGKCKWRNFAKFGEILRTLVI